MHENWEETRIGRKETTVDQDETKDEGKVAKKDEAIPKEEAKYRGRINVSNDIHWRKHLHINVAGKGKGKRWVCLCTLFSVDKLFLACD